MSEKIETRIIHIRFGTSRQIPDRNLNPKLKFERLKRRTSLVACRGSLGVPRLVVINGAQGEEGGGEPGQGGCELLVVGQDYDAAECFGVSGGGVSGPALPEIPHLLRSAFHTQLLARSLSPYSSSEEWSRGETSGGIVEPVE